jgi:hypothetical protein
VAKHPYFVAWGGDEEGAEKISELASKHPTKEAHIWIPDLLNLRTPEARVAALGSGWGGSKLGVDSNDCGDGGGRVAFGVLE